MTALCVVVVSSTSCNIPTLCPPNPISSYPFPPPGLPLSCLRLIVPPLRLLSAALWQVAKRREVLSYDKLQDFVFMVTEAFPGLLTQRQRAQLLLGLRARVRLR